MNSQTEIVWVDINAIIGTVLNILLIYIIITDTQLPGSGYKKLLIIIAVYHITFSFVHWFVELNCIYDANGFMCFSDRLRHWGHWECYWGTVLYAFMCSQSLSLFAVHCTYRYVNITGSFRFIFDRWYCVIMVGIVSLLFGAGYAAILGVLMEPTPERTALSKELLATEYNVDVETLGYAGSFFLSPDENGVMRYHIRHILATGISAMVILTIYMTTCVVGIRLYFFVQKGMYSKSARSLHMQLLCILLAQGVAPLITDFTPLAIVLTGGVFGLLPSHTSMYMPVFVSTYPAIDAIMIIFLFKAYRQRFFYNLKRCVFFWKQHEDPSMRSSLKSVSVSRIIGYQTKQGEQNRSTCTVCTHRGRSFVASQTTVRPTGKTGKTLLALKMLKQVCSTLYWAVPIGLSWALSIKYAYDNLWLLKKVYTYGRDLYDFFRFLCYFVSPQDLCKFILKRFCTTSCRMMKFFMRLLKDAATSAVSF